MNLWIPLFPSPAERLRKMGKLNPTKKMFRTSNDFRYQCTVKGVFYYSASRSRGIKNEMSQADLIYTLVFLVNISSENLLRKAISDPVVETRTSERANKNGMVFIEGWKPFDLKNRDMFPLLQGLSTLSDLFAQSVFNYFTSLPGEVSENELKVLILDNKMLTTTRSLHRICDRLRVDSFLYLQSEKEMYFAQQIRSHFNLKNLIEIQTKSRTKKSSSWIWDAFGSENSTQFDAIWLDYSTMVPFTQKRIRSLARTGSLRDIQDLFKWKLVKDGTFFGIMFNFCLTGEHWKHCEIDWFIEGIYRAAENYSYMTENIRIIKVAKFTATFPRACLIMQYSSRSLGFVAPSLTSWDAVNLAQAQSWNGWDLRRSFEPHLTSQKYKPIIPLVTFILSMVKSDGLCLHEPGFHFIAPSICGNERDSVATILLTAGDLCAERDVRSRRWQNVRIINELSERFFSDLNANTYNGFSMFPKVMVLFSESGVKDWIDEWDTLVQSWLECMGKSNIDIPNGACLLSLIRVAASPAPAHTRLEERIVTKAAEFGVFTGSKDFLLFKCSGLTLQLTAYLFHKAENKGPTWLSGKIESMKNNSNYYSKRI